MGLARYLASYGMSGGGEQSAQKFRASNMHQKASFFQHSTSIQDGLCALWGYQQVHMGERTGSDRLHTTGLSLNSHWKSWDTESEMPFLLILVRRRAWQRWVKALKRLRTQQKLTQGLATLWFHRNPGMGTHFRHIKYYVLNCIKHSYVPVLRANCRCALIKVFWLLDDTDPCM